MNLKTKLNNVSWKVKAIAGLVFLVLVAPSFAALNPFFVTEYGTVGVVSRFGKIERQTEPGLSFKIPFVEKVYFYNTQKIIYETADNSSYATFGNVDSSDTSNGISNKGNVRDASYFEKNSYSSTAQKSASDIGDLPVDTSTKDGQQISIRYTLRYRIDQSKVMWLAENVGRQDQIVQRIIQAQSRSVSRNIAREFPASELYTGDVFNYQTRVEEKLRESFDQNGVILDEFLVRQIRFSDDYIAAVEQKQIEQERVKTEEFKAKQEEFIKAQRIVRAEGEAKAQDILRQTIDPLVLQKMAIEKWNGVLPSYMSGEGNIPFIIK